MGPHSGPTVLPCGGLLGARQFVSAPAHPRHASGPLFGEETETSGWDAHWTSDFRVVMEPPTLLNARFWDQSLGRTHHRRLPYSPGVWEATDAGADG